MRTKPLLCRLRRLHTMGLLHASQAAGSSTGSLLARPVFGRLDSAGTGTTSSRHIASAVQFGGSIEGNAVMAMHASRLRCLGPVRFMGVGSFKEGDRAGQHGLRIPHAKPDGSPEKAEQDRRREFLYKAKDESASRIDEAQEPFRDSVESGQSIGEATTELQFGVKDGKSANEAIENASQELFRQSNVAGDSEGPIKEEDKQKFTVKDHNADNPQAEVASEVWGAKEHDGTSSFLDDSDKVEFHGEEDESVLGIGGRRAGKTLTDESSGPGETARENMEKTREESRKGKARSPQVGVVVGNVPSAGANALETEGDIPQFSKEQEADGSEVLEQGQKQYEQAISGFGTGGDQNLKTDPSGVNDTKF